VWNELGLHPVVLQQTLAKLDPDKLGTISFRRFLTLKELPNEVPERSLFGTVIIPEWADFVNDMEVR
tara:strand:- start:313 stop:513 length:201 start_codon:yes stop_codon:yes gene_type:complete